MDNQKTYRLDFQVVDATRLVDAESDSYLQDLEEAKDKKQILATVKFTPSLSPYSENAHIVPFKSYRSPLYAVVGPQEIQGFRAQVLSKMAEDARTHDYQRDHYSE